MKNVLAPPPPAMVAPCPNASRLTHIKQSKGAAVTGIGAYRAHASYVTAHCQHYVAVAPSAV